MHFPRTSGELVRVISTPLIHRFMRHRLGTAIGLENIPRSGPLVVVANHSSYLDHFAMFTMLHAVRPGEVWFPTKAESFEKFASRAWHESMMCYPVDRTTPGQQVFDIAQRILSDGNILVLYPEGTRGDGENMLPFKTGAFRMALAAGAKVVPVGTVGLADILPKGVHFPRAGMYSLAVGPVLKDIDKGDLRDRARHMRDDALQQVITLRDEAAANDGFAVTEHVDAVVTLAQDIISENMTEAGSISESVIARLKLLLGLATSMAGHHPRLELQLTRVEGFRALRSPFPIRNILVIKINRRARQMALTLRRSDFAAYLAARTSLLIPSYLGGGTDLAEQLFIEAAKRGGKMNSQAYVGLAEARRARGDNCGAIDAYRLAEQSIRTDDTRGELRRERIESSLQALSNGNEQ